MGTFGRHYIACTPVLILISGCAFPSGGGPNGDGPPIDTDGARSGFLYVLQPEGVSLDDIIGEAFGWLVLEPSRTGSVEDEFSVSEIEALRTTGPCGGKTVLAYLSVGEAEDYREYWNPAWVDEAGLPREGIAPGWLGPPNPDFGGNYKVRYWDPEWQAIILGTADGMGRTPLDRILDAGYDGVYLDIIDAYDFWSGNEGGGEVTRTEARERMIDWVKRISEYARLTRGVGDFLVFPQNASDIIRADDNGIDALGEDYFAAIDGIGIEDLFYNETTPQLEGEVQYLLDQLTEYRSRGKTVLVTDYVLRKPYTPADSDSRVADLYARASALGFIPYAAVEDRDLDEIAVLSSTAWSVSQPPSGCAAAAKGLSR